MADYIISGGGHEARLLKTSDPVVPKQGYGGHPIGARPKRKALTVYQGRQPFMMEIPCLLFRDGASVEQDRIAIENMATTEGEFNPDGSPQQPPLVSLRTIGAAWLPIPPALGHPNSVLWWIEDIVWGSSPEDEFRDPPGEGGAATYKRVTITFLEATRDFVLDQHTVTASQRHQYRVKKPPDTLKKIASKFHTTVATIKKLNPRIRSDGSLHNGQLITVPEPAHAGNRPGQKAPSRKKAGKGGSKARKR